MTLRVGSACTGYGGLDLALRLIFGEIDLRWVCEFDKHPSAVLAHRFPGVPNHGDVKLTNWAEVEPIDLFTAGYPCQPFSGAGLRKGKDDPRHLWPWISDAIGAVRPRLLVLENVAGHLTLGLADVLGDLAALGYDARWGVVRASDAGAPHRRERVFILASDTSGERHGRGVHPRGVGRMDGTDAGEASERERSRALAGDRSGAAAADAERERHNGIGAAVSTRGTRSGRGDAQGPANTASHPTGHGRREGRPEPARIERGSDAAQRRRKASHADSEGLEGSEPAGGLLVPAWGAYEPAIRRWERTLGRPAPRPVEPGRNGERLSPRFVEWMMGLPFGWVTDVPGLPRNAQLKALGNGVVPQQAAFALKLLGLNAGEVAA